MIKLSIGAFCGMLVLGCDSPTDTSAISIALSEQAVAIGQGASKTITVTVGRSNFDKSVALTIQGVPAGVTASLSPSSVAPGTTTSTLQISAAGYSPPGAATLTVRASGEGVAEQTAIINLSITVTGHYALSVLSPTVTVAQGGAGSATVLITRASGFAGDLAISVAGAPAGVTATLAPPTTTGTAAELRLTATSSAIPGTYTLTVTGTSPGLSSQTATLSLAVISPPSTASLRFNFCPEWAPIWFGFQNEGYAWQQVLATGTTFTFDATEKVGLALVFQFGSNVEVIILYATTSDHSAGDPDALCFFSTKSLSGSVAALASGQVAGVSMGTSIAFASPSSTSFSLTDLPSGPVDLIAARGAPSGVNTPIGPQGFTPDRFIIRRSLDVASGATIPVLDFASSEAFAPTTTSLTIAGREPTEQVNLITWLRTVTSFGTLYRARPVGESTSLYSVPTAQLAPGDLHELWVVASRSNGRRGYLAYFDAPGPRVDALGPYVGPPTVTPVSASPYVRMRGQIAAQPEYSGLAKFIFGGLANANRNVHVAVTAAYLGGTPSTWDVSVPDLSATAGFQASWMPMPGQAPYYEVDVYSSTQAFGRLFIGLPLFSVLPRAGDVLRYSGLGGPIAGTQQATAQAGLVPSVVPHFRNPVNGRLSLQMY